ncbi:MAG: tRNA (adenosine(37)-N6)-threonylcarbamoyltransferase complex ATPase subunit type 1 TsaE [Candidatus Moranbacteria bacterium]|nr:tRNA (adenosine(37)-N6)-threonylcarbamoyltransferase complex ATPase subunit type 1 TsaE [Candidatus Moranbacteria bacterium]
MPTYITNNSKETQKLGEMLAQEIKGGQIICLTGDLGSGKTTFTQGFLKGLKVKGPYTSPTFLIMKKYDKNIYHIDAYRVKAKDILALGWEEMVKDNPPAGGSVIIIEWADRLKKIIPTPPAGGSIWIKFKWLGENKREIQFV